MIVIGNNSQNSSVPPSLSNPNNPGLSKVMDGQPPETSSLHKAQSRKIGENKSLPSQIFHQIVQIVKTVSSAIWSGICAIFKPITILFNWLKSLLCCGKNKDLSAEENPQQGPAEAETPERAAEKKFQQQLSGAETAKEIVKLFGEQEPEKKQAILDDINFQNKLFDRIETAKIEADDNAFNKLNLSQMTAEPKKRCDLKYITQDHLFEMARVAGESIFKNLRRNESNEIKGKIFELHLKFLLQSLNKSQIALTMSDEEKLSAKINIIFYLSELINSTSHWDKKDRNDFDIITHSKFLKGLITLIKKEGLFDALTQAVKEPKNSPVWPFWNALIYDR